MVQQPETRRRYKRIRKAIPATVVVGKHSIAATTNDISIGGIFLFTDARFREGSELEVVLMLPREVGIPEDRMVCCRGTIVRVEEHDGQFGVAAKIDDIADMPFA